MERLVDELREASQRRDVRIEQSDVFAMLQAESCTQCCKESGGGNKECPPKTTTQ